MPLRPPAVEIVREEPPPDDQLLDVRGGRNSLTDANLERASGDCWERYGFFGVSVFAALGDELVALSDAVTQMRRRPELRLARCGGLRSARFEVAATFSNPLHFSVVLPDATPSTFAALRSCFSEPVAKPGFQADK
jgi:hypothetical protein